MRNLPAGGSGPAAVYQSRIDSTLARSRQLGQRASIVGLLRFVLFAAALLTFILAYDNRGPRSLFAPLCLGALVAFIALVIHHGSLHAQLERLRQLVLVNRAGLRRLDGTWAAAPPPPPPPAPPQYAADLDLYGPSSLAALIDTTQTRYGQAALWRALSHAAAPTTVAAVEARQEAVRELAPLIALRQSLEVAGRLMLRRDDPKPSERPPIAPPDPEPLLRWAESPPALRQLSWVRGLALLPLATLPLVLLRSLVPTAPPWVGMLAVALLAVQLLLMLWSSSQITLLLNRVSSSEAALSAYGEMLTLLVEAPLHSASNRRLQEQLRSASSGGKTMTPEQALYRLRSTFGMLELRHNPFAWFPLNVVLLWDLQFALRLERWQAEHGPQLRGWLEALGEAEALSSLAHLAHDNPDWTWPELTEAPPQALTAEGLAHPLLAADRRCGNDVTLAGPGQALLVTGSNMSGKSTLLRSIGLLAVLAQAGAPVCARRARLPLLRLRTVVRVDDSLARGLSHFYAELQRLKEVVNAASQPGAPLLYLLDEILHGTNTRERELGARLTIRTLCRRQALGVVTTHDLSLTSLEAETAGAVHNFHFTEIVEDGAMRFDYQLRPGPVRSSNALRLMRECGIDLDWSLLGPEGELPAAAQDVL